MKLSIAAIFISSIVSTVSAIGPMRASAGLMKAARRLDEEAAEEEEYAFLANYKLKLITCKPGETYVSPEDGSYEYSSVVFRLCPTNGECSDEGTQGCDSGYGDFVVGINSFVQQYLEDKRDDMQGDDDSFQVDEFGECRQYEADQDASGDGDDENAEQMYYVGPACSEDGTSIKLGFFNDEGCQTVETDVTFEEISNGVSLPYTSGGLVSNYCESCSGYNDDGEYELSEMCTMLYQNSGKCETNMETYHYSGAQDGSCEYITSIVPQQSKSGAGKTIGWLFFVLVALGAGAFAYTALKKKNDDKSFGLMNA